MSTITGLRTSRPSLQDYNEATVHPLEWLSFKNKANSKQKPPKKIAIVGEVVQKLETLCMVDGTVAWTPWKTAC